MTFEKPTRVFCVLAAVTKVPSLSGAHKMVSTHVLGKNWCGYYGVN
jgi:hypothetical protein